MQLQKSLKGVSPEHLFVAIMTIVLAEFVFDFRDHYILESLLFIKLTLRLNSFSNNDV